MAEQTDIEITKDAPEGTAFTSDDHKSLGPAQDTTQSKRLKNLALSRLSSSHRRETIVKHNLLGNVYGHRNLLGLRFTKRNITHDAFKKLIQPDGKKAAVIPEPTVGLHYKESNCYCIPDELFEANTKPVEVEREVIDPKTKLMVTVTDIVRVPQPKPLVGNGESGVIEYHWANINEKPGAYILMAAVEKAIQQGFLKPLLRRMKMKLNPNAPTTRVDEKTHAIKQITHLLSAGHLSELMATPDTAFLHICAAFFKKWSSGVQYTDGSAGVKTVVPKRTWHPLPIPSSDGSGALSANSKYIIDNIIFKRSEVRSERGRNLYQKMVAEGKLPTPSTMDEKEAKERKKKEEAAAKKGTAGPKRAPPPKSSLDKAVEADRKKSGPPKVAPKKVEERGFDLALYLSQKDFTKILMVDLPEASGLVGKIAPEVRRFIDDLYNYLLLNLTGISTNFMVASKSLTLTEATAFSAIKSFFLIVGADELERVCTMHATDIARCYSNFQKKKSDKVKAKAAFRAANAGADAVEEEEEEGDGEEEEDGDDVGEDLVASFAAVPPKE